jgi:hypothetical protein
MGYRLQRSTVSNNRGNQRNCRPIISSRALLQLRPSGRVWASARLNLTSTRPPLQTPVPAVTALSMILSGPRQHYSVSLSLLHLGGSRAQRKHRPFADRVCASPPLRLA